MKFRTILLALCLLSVTPEVGIFSNQVAAQEKQSHYSQKSSRGQTYFLFSREQKLKNSNKVITMYYFAKDPNNTKGKPVEKVPQDREVSETKNGLLVLKKKK